MMKKILNKTLCPLIVISFLINPHLIFAQQKNPDSELRAIETAMQLQKLIKEKQAQGADISSTVLELDKQSRAEMQNGNPQACLKLLTQAIGLLQTNSAYDNSPFGIHDVRFDKPEEVVYINDLQAKTARMAPYESFVWDLIEIKDGIYHWNTSDRTISAGYQAGVNLIAMAFAQNRLEGTQKDSGMLPQNMHWYLSFLEKAIERYDGDGKNDAPGSPKIVAVQIDNEMDGPFWQDTPENYALLLKKSYRTIKKADRDIKVICGGCATPLGFRKFYKPMFKELARIKDHPDDQYFDIFDFHWSGQWDGDNDYAEIKFAGKNWPIREFISEIKDELDKLNYKNVSLYITETSDYSDSPSRSQEGDYPYHTEAYHAASIIKRYVYFLASGIDKIFWSQIVEEHCFGGQINGYFDNIALVNNPQNPDGLRHKKLGYYAYKRMVEKLEGSDWHNIKILKEKDGIYLYKLIKDNKTIYVAWNDNQTAKKISLEVGNAKEVRITEAIPKKKYKTGKEIKGDENIFEEKTINIIDQEISINLLSDRPIYIELEN